MDERRWDVVDVDDLPELWLEEAASFFDREFPGTFEPRCTAAMFRWKLGASNPAGTGHMTIAVHEGAVVGTMTATKKRVLVDGEELLAAEVGDTFTDPAFRRGGLASTAAAGADPDHYLNKSIFGRLVRETTDRLRTAGVPFVFGTPNANSRPGYVTRCGYLLVDSAEGTSWRRLTSERLRRAGAASAIRPVASVLDATLAVAAVRARRPIGRWSLDEIVTVDRDAVDALWQRARPATGLAVVQDGRWFEHRFAMHPDLDFETFALTREGTLVGLIIGRHSIDPEGRHTYLVVDWLVDPSSSGLLTRALAEVVRRRRASVESVSLWTSNAGVRSALFARGPSVPVILDDTPLARALDEHQTHWDLHRAWSDNA